MFYSVIISFRSRLLMTAALAAALPAHGQEAAPAPVQTADAASTAAAPGADEQIDTVVVTGTRTARKAEDSEVPIQVVGTDDLMKTGKQNIRDALEQLLPSFYNSAGWVGQAGESVKAASLRGLEGDKVLVLVNGKRRHATSLIFYGAPTNNGASPADLDLIPASSIDHIEVLTDGAAAQYGSDAIAGVINIVLKSSPDSGTASVTYGRYASSPSGPLAAYGDTEQLELDDGVPLFDRGGFIHFSGDFAFHDNTNTLGPQRPTTRLTASRRRSATTPSSTCRATRARRPRTDMSPTMVCRRARPIISAIIPSCRSMTG